MTGRRVALALFLSMTAACVLAFVAGFALPTVRYPVWLGSLTVFLFNVSGYVQFLRDVRRF